MNKILIWDLDGTLLDSFGVYSAVLANVLPKHGFAMPTVDVLAKNFHGALEESIGNSLGNVTPEELQAILADFLREQDNHYEVIEHHLFADAKRLVGRAHAAGYRQILVTNREHEGRLKGSPRHIVKNSSLVDYIDAVICGDDSEHRKPKPEVLGGLLEQLADVQVLVVGDQFVDAAFAQNLGVQGVLVNRSASEIAHLDQLGADWQKHTQVVTSLDDVTV